MKLMAQASVQIRESSCPNLSNRELVRCHHLEAADLVLHPRPGLHLPGTRASSSHQMEPCLERSMWLYLLLWKLGELQPTFFQREGGIKTLRFSFLEDSSVQSLSHARLFATPWTVAHQASLFITNSWSLLKLMSIESVMPSSHLILCHSLLLLFPNPSQHQGLFQWVSSSHQVAKVLEFQLQHQSFQWIFLKDTCL